MKKLFTYILIISLIGCKKPDVEICKKGIAEKQYDFLTDLKIVSNLNGLKTIVNLRQYGLFSPFKSLRNPKSLKLTYSSLKQVGLKKLISEQDYKKHLFTNHWKETPWENKSLNQIVKNLISSYSDTTRVDQYYIKFWNRRKKENNDSVVLQIFKDINRTYNTVYVNNEIQDWNSEPIITKLVEFDIRLKNALNIKEINIEYFNYLRKIGLYSSANNLIRYENEYSIDHFNKSDKDYLKLIDLIETDSVSCDEYYNWRNQAQWIDEFYDYGP